MSGKGIRTDSAPAPVGAYPHARRVGDLVFLSGVGPRQPGSNAIPGNVHDTDGRLVRYDIEAQCRQVFANVRAVLEASGAQWTDLVDVTVFLTDMHRGATPTKKPAGLNRRVLASLPDQPAGVAAGSAVLAAAFLWCLWCLWCEVLLMAAFGAASAAGAALVAGAACAAGAAACGAAAWASTEPESATPATSREAIRSLRIMMSNLGR